MTGLWGAVALALAGPEPNQELHAWLEADVVPEVHPVVAADYAFARTHMAEVAAVAKRKPGAVQVDVIGRSVRDQPIWAVHVLEPGCSPEREVLVFAGIHALEWISTEVAMAILYELMELPQCDVGVTVIPILNPDGRANVEADLVEAANRYRRGNGAVPAVDLNRDFAYQRQASAAWRGLPILKGYYGTTDAPLSQPESRALDALVAARGYERAVSLHAFGGYHYFPWSGSFQRPDDWDTYMALGRQMERAQADHAYRPRQLGRWGFFFRAHGTEIDHLYGEHGTLAFLMELTRSGLQPLRPASRRTYFRWYNPVHPTRHVARGVAAVRALIRAEPPQK